MSDFEFKTMPHSEDAEKALLGAMLISNKNISRAIEMLDKDAFYNMGNKQIYQAIMSLYEKNQAADPLTVSEYLSSRNQLEDIGGSRYLVELTNYVANSSNFDDYAKIVTEKFIKRSLIETSESIIENARNETSDALEQIDSAEAKIFSIAEKRLKKSYLSLKSLSRETYTIIKNIRKGDLNNQENVLTHFYDLDHLLGGLHKSDLIIIAARPSMGKTALAMSIARNIALHSRMPVAFFSLEMSAHQLVTRLISSEAKIDQHKITKGIISNEDDSRIVESLGVIAELPIYIDDSAALTVMEIRAKARRMKTENGIRAIFIDYLQLISSHKAESREREISMISRSLKQLAKELDIPVVALSQLNRDVEKRPDKRPMLSDLRESGSIEQDADVVMFVHRPEYFGIQFFDKEKKYSTLNMAEVIVGKQRNGPTGTARLAFIKNYARFENAAIGMNESQEVDNLDERIESNDEVDYPSYENNYQDFEEESVF